MCRMVLGEKRWRTRRVFPDEFKREAVRLVEQPDGSVSRVARNLGAGAQCPTSLGGPMRRGDWEPSSGKPLKNAHQLTSYNSRNPSSCQ